MSRAIPPLILIAQGRKPRLRRTLVDRPLEIKLHMSVAKLLRDHAKPTWQWAHYPSGELRDKRTAGKLKQWLKSRVAGFHSRATGRTASLPRTQA